MGSIFSAKAKENLRAAEMLFADRMYNASANRAYYAAFHAAVAALSSAGIQLGRIKQEAVQAKFNGELIRRKKVYPGRFKSYLLELQAVRDNADYKLILVSEKVARRQLNKAKEYVETLLQETDDVQ
ncbi:MAG: HEPN domain-containing protein [Proteobacteria bacterium]|nr:HEPN domain-containing protein [Pseudomonadota bacterium]